MYVDFKPFQYQHHLLLGFLSRLYTCKYSSKDGMFCVNWIQDLLVPGLAAAHLLAEFQSPSALFVPFDLRPQ